MKKTGQLPKSMDVTILRDVPYAKQSEAQKLDIYMLTKRRKPSPVIMWMHPGGFYEGDKDGSAIAPSGHCEHDQARPAHVAREATRRSASTTGSAMRLSSRP